MKIQKKPYGKFPEADMKLSEFAKFKNDKKVEKFRNLVDEHTSKDPLMLKIIKKHKELVKELEKTGKYAEKGNEFSVKLPDSQNMLLMSQPKPGEMNAFCDLLINKKVDLILTLCSPYEDPKEVIAYYDPQMGNVSKMLTQGRSIQCLARKILFEGKEAALVPEVNTLVKKSKFPVDLKSESLKQWRPQVIQYQILVKNKTGSHQLNVLHYKNWPDGKFAPDLQALEVMFQTRDKLLPHEDQPLLIHCKAGIGRTGNVALLDWARMRIKKSQEQGVKLDDITFNIPEMLYELRRTRPKLGSGHKKIAQVYGVIGQYYTNALRNQTR